jgi:probable phosphoglycerate mutase
MSGRIFLLRHGETEWSANGRHTGRTDIPLTDAGRGLAEAAGTLLSAVRGSVPSGQPPAAVACSPMRRAKDTAALAGLEPAIDQRLHEWDYGEYEGLTTPQIRATVPGWTVWTHPCPGGESADQVGARADEVLESYRARLDAGDVVLVGHGHFSRVLTARWLGLPANAGVGFQLDAGGLTVLGDERGVPRLDHVNLVTP